MGNRHELADSRTQLPFAFVEQTEHAVLVRGVVDVVEHTGEFGTREIQKIVEIHRPRQIEYTRIVYQVIETVELDFADTVQHIEQLLFEMVRRYRAVGNAFYQICKGKVVFRRLAAVQQIHDHTQRNEARGYR